jgi:hypothetical protein
MKPKNHALIGASTAIAAALALSATPLAAQSADAAASAEPTLQAQPVTPPPAEAATPAPTVIVPDVTAAPAAVERSPATASSPVVQPLPEPSASPATPAVVAPPPKRAARAATPSASPPAVSRASAAVPAAANDTVLPADTAAESAAAADTAAIPAVLPVAAEPRPAVAPTPTQTRDVTGVLGAILIALVALAIAAGAFMFFRRRHPASDWAEEAAEQPRSTDTPAQSPAETAIGSPSVEPVAADRAAEASVVATPLAAASIRRPPTTGALPSDGASIDLPAKAPDTYEERSALLARMVEARPDKANPFTDRRARLRRARLILQSLGHTFDREPWIDLSQYPNNWPELARPKFKAA